MINSELNKSLNQYYRSIESSLVCDRQRKTAIISAIRSSVSEFLEDHPNADFDSIEKHFGSPQDIAEEYYANADSYEIQSRLRIRKIIIISVILTLIIAIMIYSVAIASIVISGNKSANGYDIAEIEVISESDNIE